MSAPLLNLFIIAMSVAVIIQLGILIGLYVSVRQSSVKMEALATDFHRRATPVLDGASAILNDSRDKLRTITENLAVASTSIRSQVERMDATVSDVIVRARLQVIRADEMVSRTLDRVEETSEIVQHSVISPVRQLAGIVSGLTVGVNAFFRRGARRATEGVREDEELFI